MSCPPWLKALGLINLGKSYLCEEYLFGKPSSGGYSPLVEFAIVTIFTRHYSSVVSESQKGERAKQGELGKAVNHRGRRGWGKPGADQVWSPIIDFQGWVGWGMGNLSWANMDGFMG